MDQGLLQGPSWEWYCSYFWVPGCPIGPVHGQRRLRGKKRVVLCSPAFQLIRTAKQSPPAAKAHPAPAGAFEHWELLKLLEQRSSLKISDAPPCSRCFWCLVAAFMAQGIITVARFRWPQLTDIGKCNSFSTSARIPAAVFGIENCSWKFNRVAATWRDV